jgi:hypothetical protein
VGGQGTGLFGPGAADNHVKVKGIPFQQLRVECRQQADGNKQPCPEQADGRRYDGRNSARVLHGPLCHG